MRKTILALVAVALMGMTAGYAQAGQDKGDDTWKATGSDTSTSSGSGTGGSTDTDRSKPEGASTYGGTRSGGSSEVDRTSTDRESTDSDMRTGGGAGGAVGEAEDTGTILKGWSAKKAIIGKDVYNEKDEKVGKVEDIIITPEKYISYAIVGAGGFLGVGEHYVAVPISEVKMKNNKFIMSGATKEQLKQRPKFEYKKRNK